mmetsp:Transcript_44412/g.118565  ORF Transcript_44412/g.118565 Transcript_44412/m.118565 type:complete len:210 (+) Transcript_44412:29-658(+)
MPSLGSRCWRAAPSRWSRSLKIAKRPCCRPWTALLRLIRTRLELMCTLLEAVKRVMPLAVILPPRKLSIRRISPMCGGAGRPRMMQIPPASTLPARTTLLSRAARTPHRVMAISSPLTPTLPRPISTRLKARLPTMASRIWLLRPRPPIALTSICRTSRPTLMPSRVTAALSRPARGTPRSLAARTTPPPASRPCWRRTSPSPVPTCTP